MSGTDWRALCEELASWIERSTRHYIQDPDVLIRARAALATEPVADGPAVPEGREPASVAAEPSDERLLHPARSVLTRWSRPAPVPVASDVYFEFVISDADYCTQAGGIAPTYTQALSEGQHYLAQYQQDAPHTLEVRRVEILPANALPQSSGEVKHG